MADRRKLQSEIERCMKKVNEGVETFDDIWKKVHHATNSNQKEKYEADLKKEIKKLQRLRDQIKTWLASNEIKDKRGLIDYRKLIETQMERFKIVERETKTKAYSKEGLGAAQKLDPAQKEKDDITNWLSTSIETLSVQVDQYETEIENLQHAQKKSKKDREKQARHEFLKKRLDKHRFHITQLETLMRMLDNETVKIDQVKKIKDDVDYYIDSSHEVEFQDIDYIYDDLDLESFRASNLVVDSTNVLAKNAAGNNSGKNENANSIGENDENITFSNSSSSNESPVPSPGLQNSHSTKSTNNNGNSAPSTPATTPNNNSTTTHEFALITNSPSTVTTTTLTSSINPSTKISTVWSSTSNTVKSSTSSPITQSACSVNTPYAAALASSVNTPTKLLPTNENNETTTTTARVQQAISTNSSSHHELINHTPSTSAVVTLYSAAAASATPVTSTASVTNNPWNTNVSNSSEISNQTNISTRHQLQSSNTQMQLTPQQQQFFLQQQQQQQQNHILNGFKTMSNVEHLKGLTHQVVANTGLDDHLVDHNLLHVNMSNINLNTNSPNVNTMNQMAHLNEMTNASAQNSTNMHLDHMTPSNLLKTNLMLHQRNSQMMQGNTPVSSVSPPNNNVPTNVNSLNSISNVDTKNMSSNVNTIDQHVVNMPANQNQSQRMFPVFPAQQNKILSKQLYYQMQLLESAYRHPIIPLDSYRAKPLMKMFPAMTTPHLNSNYPNQTLPQFDNPDFYKHLQAETLFFIFYYMEGTKAQYMAAQTLKKNSWRFHTKHMMWFQRLEEPQMITDEFEKGSYIFFDFEKWTQRKKDNFTFEYKYLEDKEL